MVEISMTITARRNICLAPFECPNCQHELLVDKIRRLPDETDEVVSIIDIPPNGAPVTRVAGMQAFTRAELERNLQKALHETGRLLAENERLAGEAGRLSRWRERARWRK